MSAIFSVSTSMRKYINKQECIYHKIIMILKQVMNPREKEAKTAVLNTRKIIIWAKVTARI